MSREKEQYDNYGDDDDEDGKNNNNQTDIRREAAN